MERSLDESTGPHYSTRPRDLEARLPAGTVVVDGRFEILEEVARGGMAIVYRANDRHEGTVVAFKVVTAGAQRSETAARFANEARLGASLAGHPHVVSPVAVGRLGGPRGFVGRMYLVTEFVDGVSADVLMGAHATGLPLRRACRVARDVGRALVDLHARGIVHRDIKPGNVLLEGRGPEENARLLDFGLAYATGDGWECKSPDLTADGHAPGTPLYMSPQQVSHEQPTPQFDVYSFGVMLYEFFCGDPPYEGYAIGDLLARKCDPSAAPFPIGKMRPDLPAAVTDLVDRCLRYEPSERPSAAQLVQVLDSILADPSFGRAPSTARRWTPVVILTALTALAALVASVWWNTPSEAPTRSTTTDEPILAAAPYSKVDDLGGSDLGGGGASALAPDIPPVASPVPPPRPLRPEPKRSKPARGKEPPAAAPQPEEEQCPDNRRATANAASNKQWARVLRLTKRPKCWPDGSTAERVRLRTQALFETNRYQECAELGHGSSDPSVARWAATCSAHLAKDEAP